MPENRHTICQSQNKKSVWYDPVHSHTATHFEDTSGLLELVIEAVSKLELTDASIDVDIDMGRVIGTSSEVETDDSDEIIYAVRKNREDQGHVPFTKSRKVVPCSTLSLHLLQKDNDTYELLSAWIGTDDSPTFPEDPAATVNSKDYWNKHALVWGSQEIVEDSETSLRPW